MRRPQTPQRRMPPESSQSLSPLFELGLFLRTTSRAASTRARGTPESGTGTAIHSSLRFGVTFTLRR
jgi:hypothetical protein